MKYVVYKTTNLLNSKIYIGVHKLKHDTDPYNGSGKAFIKAKAKYGEENFSREILFEYDNPDDAFEKEAELVTPEFVKLDSNYNLIPGGKGGRSKILSTETKMKISSAKSGIPRPQYVKDKVSKTRLERKIPSPNKGKEFSKQHKESLKIAAKTRPSRKMNDTTRMALLKANSVPHSIERRLKQSKRLMIGDIEFNSCTEAAKYFKISNSSVSFRLKSNDWPDWKYYDKNTFASQRS